MLNTNPLLSDWMSVKSISQSVSLSVSHLIGQPVSWYFLLRESCCIKFTLLTPMSHFYSLWKRFWKLLTFSGDITQPTQRRSKNVLILVSKTSQIGLKWKSRRPFFKTSSGHLPGDVLGTFSRRCPQDVLHETPSRPP